ncbi:phosphate ABC transporter substrate-binding protein PstS [bacterium]|nr:phosphate ABC transporter substrate-binding protein PstS [bacterium]
MNRLLVSILTVAVMWASVGSVTAAEINGSGATFPAILLQKMFDRFRYETGVTVNYVPNGSFTGLADLSGKRSQFAVSDFRAKDVNFVGSDQWVDLPITLGGVAIVYNIPEVPLLKLSSSVLLRIFKGEITRWNDPDIVVLNPKFTLPDLSITLVERSDMSGTTVLLNRYLSASDSAYHPTSDWKIDGETSRKASGNGEVVNAVQEIRGAIGYTEWHYAVQSACKIVALGNPSGQYVMPSVESILAALENVSVDDIGTAGMNSKNDFAYPIVGFSWISTYADQSHFGDYAAAKTMIDFLWWSTHQGQLFAEDNGFAPLPPAAMRYATQRLKQIRYDDVIIR